MHSFLHGWFSPMMLLKPSAQHDRPAQCLTLFRRKVGRCGSQLPPKAPCHPWTRYGHFRRGGPLPRCSPLPAVEFVAPPGGVGRNRTRRKVTQGRLGTSCKWTGLQSAPFPNTVGKQSLGERWKLAFDLQRQTPCTVPGSELALSNWQPL